MDRNGVGDLLVVIEVLSFGVLGLTAIIVIWFEGSEACRARGAKLCGSMRSSVSAWIHSFWAQRLARITRNAHLLGAPKVLVVPIAGANSPHLPPRLDLGRLSPLRHADRG